MHKRLALLTISAETVCDLLERLVDEEVRIVLLRILKGWKHPAQELVGTKDEEIFRSLGDRLSAAQRRALLPGRG